MGNLDYNSCEEKSITMLNRKRQNDKSENKIFAEINDLSNTYYIPIMNSNPKEIGEYL